jgi:MATE family multidrug resistance protein
LFTDQQEVVRVALAVFAWTVTGPAVSSFCYIWDGIFIGATATAPMRNSMLVATLLVFLPTYGLGIQYLGLGNHAIWLALTLFMVARGVALSAYAPKYIFAKSATVSYAE